VGPGDERDEHLRAEVAPPDPWELRHSPYTPEGEIEGAGKFAAASTSLAPHGRRVVRIVVIVTLLAMAAPVVIGMVLAILQ
jgi:hypothetical protein